MSGPTTAAVVLAVLAAALVADRSTPAATVPRPAWGRNPMPVLDGPLVVSSTWFCPTVRATSVGIGDGVVVVANTADQPRTAVVRFVGDGVEVVRRADLPPFGRMDVAIPGEMEAAAVAARVDVDGGGVGVERRLPSAQGPTSSPCGHEAATTWFAAAGSTAKDAVAALVIYNPFPDPAIVDAVFATEQGRAEPVDLTGLVIEPRQVKVVDLTQFVRRRDRISASITTRSGRVVTDRLQRYDGSAGRRGVAVGLASPSAGAEWYFPDGQVGETVTELLFLHNPGDDDAEVDVEVRLAEGDVEPLAVTVPPHDTEVVDMAADAGVPAGVAHATIVRVLNGLPVVADRELRVAGATRNGMSLTGGSRLTAARWVFVDGRADDEVDEWLVAFNPADVEVRLTLSGLVNQPLPIAEGREIVVPPRGRVSVRLGDHIRRSPLSVVVDATGPIVVERDLYNVGSFGLSAAMGIPAPAATSASR